jgi:hypothetical protein
MESPADETIGDEAPFAAVPAGILNGKRVTFEQLSRLIEAKATIFDVAPALGSIVLDFHAPSLNCEQRGAPGNFQPTREVAQC